jgi:hypothetical protein
MKVKELDRRKLGLTDTDSSVRPGDFPIGSRASRAAARIKLENWGGDVAPNLSLVFYESDGSRTEANFATIDGGNKPPIHVNRLQGETFDEFQLRVETIMAGSRGRGKPRGAIFQ